MFIFRCLGIAFCEVVEDKNVNNVLCFHWLETGDLERMTMFKFMSMTSPIHKGLGRIYLCCGIMELRCFGLGIHRWGNKGGHSRFLPLET